MKLDDHKWTAFHEKQLSEEAMTADKPKDVGSAQITSASSMPDLSDFIPGDNLLQLDPSSK